MSLHKKITLLLLAFSLSAFGQSNGIYNATTYAYTTQITRGNTSTGSSSIVANPTAFAQGIPFLPYNLNAPITLDRNAANAETITPGPISNCYPNSLTCTLSGTFTYKHTAGETIQSGTFGLQEAVNVAVVAGSGTVLIDASWGGPSGTTLITAAKGNDNVLIQDNRNPSGPVFYQWNGSAYVQTGGGNTVSSVFGRTGTVTAQTGDYTCAQVTNCATSGVQSINGDTTAAQQINVSGTGLSRNTAAGVTTITLAGGGLTGTVNAGNFGQVTSYPTTGGATTVGGNPQLYALNPQWTLAQMNALFSRFGTVSITAWSITSNVATFTAVNSYSAGDQPALISFPTSTFFNNQFVTVLSTGLSNTQFEVSFTHANGSATEAGGATLIEPAVGDYSYGTVIIPNGLIDQPANVFTNRAAQVIDSRRGWWFQQASQYGVQCDLRSFNVTLTSGSNTVTVGASFPGNVNANGMTMVVGQQVGFGQGGLQEDWTPTVVSGGGTGTLTLSANAPFNYSGKAFFGTNNAAALTAAFNDVGGIIPLHFPTGCQMLTSTVRWPGTSLIGQQMSNSGFTFFPGSDGFQQQDGTPITAWSINTGTGLTTFTVPSYSAHSILTGDSILLEHFGTSTFFNNQTVSINSHPTPTTFTVASVFSQSTSSANEAGLAAPTTNVGTNGLIVKDLTFNVNNMIDPSFPWNHYDASATLTTEPPLYRPLQLHGQPMNDPYAPGWGAGQVEGVATITQNSAVICAPNAGNIPAVGTHIIFPYQGSGEFSGTVSSTAGSCSGGFTPRTLSAALPNTSAFTATQAAWFTFTTPQTLSVAIPSTISYPYTITLNLPFPPVPGWEANVSSHGRIIINGDQFDYMGDNFGGTAGGSPTLTLRDGPTSINSGAGSAVSSVVFPLNPCYAMYNNPWPVVPSINAAGTATPAYATYYAGICGGNAALSMPSADAVAWTPTASGLSVAHFDDIAVNPTSSNSLGNQNNNGSMFMYQAGNNTGYGNTFNDIRDNFTWGGFMQGPSSVNQQGVRGVGPTSTGQSISNCTFRTGYAITLVNMEQSNIDRCDTYSTEVSPYDGTVVGASTGLYLSYTLGEQDGGGVTNVAQFTVKDYNDEPENGNHDEIPVAVESDGTIVNWIGTIFEGGFNIFGGSYQIFHGTQLSNPVFNYGNNNYFEHMSGLNTGYFSQVYNGEGFYNWGQFSQGECSNGSSGAANTICGIGFVQGYNGHDMFSSMMGSQTNPTENILGGMILPGEFGEVTGVVGTPDSTELWWGSHANCTIGTGLQCGPWTEFGGFNGYIYIGPHQRITDSKMVLKANVKLATSGTATFRILLQASNPTSSCVTPNFSLATATRTATSAGWTQVTMPVDFTGYAGCVLGVQIDQGSTSNVLQVGYFNFIPFTGQLYLPLATPSSGAVCPVAGEISIDSTHMWVCAPTSGATFGAGTWKSAGIS